VQSKIQNPKSKIVNGVAALGMVALLAVALAPPARAVSQDDRPWRRYDADAVKAIEKMEAGKFLKGAARVTEPDTSGYDVQKYTIRYAVDFDARSIRAEVRIDALTTATNVSTVDLDFRGFTISDVRIDDQPASYERTNGNNVLRVQIGDSPGPGRAFSVTVAYSGTPSTFDGLGFGFTSHGAATFAEPEGARGWFPCKDRPSDKATYEGFITVPSGMKVASNGRLVDDTPDGNRRTFHWLETHPISTYLISLAISDYRVIEDQHGALPLRHYVYPDREEAARRDFSRTPQMLQAFEERLGVPYPFDKYGHALFENFGGAMEHQSMTSYGASLITGDNRFDSIVAHELGHQWFGDLVSPAAWEEIWLNEGFATWTEFLWMEHFDPEFLPELMENRERFFFAYEQGAGQYALYDPGFDRLFGSTIYQKGGWVVAMLRYVVGDEAFFAGIREYLNGHAFGNATSEDLRAALEASSGQDLSAFFAQWVYGVGYPTYEVAWSARPVSGGRFQADLRVRQTQTGTPVFTIPLEVEIVAADGTRTRQRVDVTSANQVVSLCLDSSPNRIVVDPDNRVLGTVTASDATVPSQPSACGVTPGAIVVTGVRFEKSDSRESLIVEGAGFVVGDSRVEVNGVELAKTKYPKRYQADDGTTTGLAGKQARLGRDIVPRGTTVQVTVVNLSTGERSEGFAFTR
jgi:aminopeptidase N